MSALASVVESRAEELLGRWVERLRGGIVPDGRTELELRDHVPTLLRELAQALRSGHIPERSGAAEAHGRQRYRIGIALESLVREYGALLNVVLDVMEEQGLAVSLPEVRVLSDFVSNAIAEGVTEHNDRQRAHERKKEQELLMFKALVEATDDFIAVADRDVTLRYLNPAAWRLAGFSSMEEALDHRVPGEMIAVDAGDGAAREAVAVTLAGRSWEGELAVVNRASGQTIPLEAHTIPIRGSDGSVQFLGTINRDIRVRRESEAERRDLFEAVRAARDDAEAEREKLERLFREAPVAIGIHEGPEHTCTFANPAYIAVVGGRDIVGKTLFDALPELRGQGFDALFDLVKSSGKPFVAEAQPATLVRDGKLSTAWFTFVFAPKRNAAGEIDGVMQCAVDVTAQVEVHRQAELSLQHQAEFEQQLIGIVSHDLRNPLNVISLSSMLLKRDETLGPRSLQFVVRIQNAAERAVRMVGDLLDFTQARLGGGIQVRLQPANVQAVVGAVVDEVGAAYPDRTLNVVHEGDGSGAWDPDRLGQVVQNLVTNALKYSPPSTPVNIATRPCGDEVCLLVHNEGAPIPAEKRAVLFEPYQRAVSQTDKLDRSIGLGLYIVKKIIDAHHGTIAVESTEAGTTFTVALPRK